MKGHYTQGVAVLLQRPVSLDALEECLGSFHVVGRRDAAEQWVFGGPSLLLAFRPEVNGYVTVDLVEQPWPDHMGDPKQEVMLFGAWSMGNFGPFTFPGNLKRAGQHCWAWQPARTIAEQHTALLRIRSSYVFGADENARVMPDDYDSLCELAFVTDVAVALLDLPEALCYFNPNGELLRGREEMVASLEYARANDLPPLDIWSNIRLFKLPNDWTMMDTVGMWQLDVPDHEACFPTQAYDCNEVDHFLRNASFYVMEHGEIIQDGDTMDGAGNVRWQAKSLDEGLTEPPRRLLRWLPCDESEVPAQLLGPLSLSDQGLRCRRSQRALAPLRCPDRVGQIIDGHILEQVADGPRAQRFLH